MSLNCILLSKISQIQKVTYHVSTYMASQKGKTVGI